MHQKGMHCVDFFFRKNHERVPSVHIHPSLLFLSIHFQRTSLDKMAELHVIGEITGASGFGGQSLFATFEFVTGLNWSHVGGQVKGTTHIMENTYDGIAWSTPLDVHFSMPSVQGWPKIAMQIWSLDGHGRQDLQGYGVCFVPLPALQDVVIEVPTWKPTYWHPSGMVRWYRQFRQMFMGGNPVLRNDTIVHSNDDRYRLNTTSGGTVTLRLNVITRNAALVGLKMS
jgi:B9 domain-containing protein 2